MGCEVGEGRLLWFGFGSFGLGGLLGCASSVLLEDWGESVGGSIRG